MHWLGRHLRTRLELHCQHSQAEEQRSHGEISMLVVDVHVGMTTLYQIQLLMIALRYKYVYLYM